MEKENSSTPILPYSHTPTRGFTLVEVLLVVVIILIAAGVSVPLFRGTFQSTRMKDAVRSTIRMSRYARSLSILRQEQCMLRFDGGQLSLFCGETNAAGPEISRRLPEDITVSDFENLSEAGSPSEKEYAVRFDPAGMNDGFSVTFRDDKDRRTTVTCNPVSGKTAVEGME